ncbi:MAG: BACON domain-containing protein [Candidatus Hydrogenedentes bacterium]|nr:BACON domain-containing protein [Candidatus Hydrogenedentota bacterium]
MYLETTQSTPACFSRKPFCHKLLRCIGTWAFAAGMLARPVLAQDPFDFGDGHHGSRVIPSGETDIATLYNQIRGGADSAVYNPANVNAIPQFENLTISSGGSLSVSAFSGDPAQIVDPRDGGVIRIKVHGTLLIHAGGRIDASGKGYRGGTLEGAAPGLIGQRGDSWGIGGDIGNTSIRGGGGGGFGELPGQGNPGSGGGGGHLEPGEPGLAGDGSPLGGRGGLSFDDVAAEESSNFLSDYPFPRFGSGGGRGGQTATFAADASLGGRGGGVVIIEAREIINLGAIRANGAKGGDDLSGGGGGAGGSIQIRSLSAANGVVTATGGAGGVSLINDNNGGAGGAGIPVWDVRHELDLIIVGLGQVTQNPLQLQYIPNTPIILTPFPNTGWLFDRWEGDLIGEVTPSTVVLNRNKAVTAVFVEKPFLIVSPSSAGISAAGGNLSFLVENSGLDSVKWAASVQGTGVDFVSIVAGATGVRGQSVTLSVLPNTTGKVRQATVRFESTDAQAPVTAVITQSFAEPVLDVTPKNQTPSPEGGAVSFAIRNTGTGNLTWIATIQEQLPVGQDFVTISAGSTGTVGAGLAGTLVVTAAQNSTLAERTAKIRIDAGNAEGSPIDVTITQQSRVPKLSVEPASRSIAAAGGSVTFAVENRGTGIMTWNSDLDDEGKKFLTIVAGSSGTNNAPLSLQVAPHTGTTPRTGTVTITAPGAIDSPKTVTVTQSANETELIVDRDERTIGAAGGTVLFAVTNGGTGTMNWTSQVNSESINFLTILSGSSGTNAASISVLVGAYTGTVDRVGAITITAPGALNSPKTITVTQRPNETVLQVDPEERVIASSGGSVAFSVTNGGTGTMNWTSSVDPGSANFLTLVSGSAGSNTGPISVLVAPHIGTTPRAGTITITAPGASDSPRTVTVLQSANETELLVDREERLIGAAGGSVSFSVTNGDTGTMAWTSQVDPDSINFLSILSGSSGTNTGLISVQVAPYTGTANRAGTITITAPGATNSPKTVTVTQSPNETVLQVDPEERVIAAAGGSVVFTVTNGGTGTMNWTSSVDTASANYLTLLSGTTGTNAGPITVQVAPYTGTAPRTGAITVVAPGASDSPKTVTVTQSANDTLLLVDPDERTIGATGGTVSFTVSNGSTGAMNWTSKVDPASANFLSIVAGANGTNTGPISIQVLPHMGTTPRTGTIIVTAPGASESPKSVTVIQSANDAVLRVTPATQSIGSAGGTTTFNILNDGTGTLNWNARVASGEDYTTISSAATGINAGALSVTVAPNKKPEARRGTLVVQDTNAGGISQTVEVNQAGCEVPARPQNLNASSGAFIDKVNLIWSTVPGATRYEIFRALENDPQKAVLLAETPTPSFVDLSALPPDEDLVVSGCLEPVRLSVEYFYYYYWVKAVNECGSSIISVADDGHVARPEDLLDKTRVSVEALPYPAVAQAEPGLPQNSRLAVQLPGEDGVDVASVWGELDTALGSETALWTLQTVSGEDNNVWVYADPDTGWLPGDTLTLTAGGKTPAGEAIAPVTQVFQIAVEKTLDEAGAAPLKNGESFASFPGAVGEPWQLGPVMLFDAPVQFWIPVPEGVSADSVHLYYATPESQEGLWHAAEDVAGWLADPAYAVRIVDGLTEVGVTVNHGGFVQLGVTPEAKTESSQAAGMLPGRYFGGEAVAMVVALMVLAVASRRYRRASGSK